MADKATIPPANKPEPIKIKEFEWYEVETRVREIMGEILQPFNKKQVEETVKLNELKRQVGAIAQRQ